MSDAYAGPEGQADPTYQRFARLAQAYVGAPVSLVSFVDEVGQVFPGALGLPEPWMSRRGTELSHSFCQYVVSSDAPLVVTDAREVEFLRDNLAIPDLSAIAYAGFPVRDLDGQAVGSLCAIDDEPRVWTTEELAVLADLAQACSSEVQLRSLGERARRAQRAATQSDRHARLLLLMSEAFADAVSVDDVLDTIQRVAVTAAGSRRTAVAVVHEQHLRWVRHEEVDGVPAVLWRDVALSDARWPSVVAVTGGGPQIFEDAAAMAAAFPSTAGLGGDGALAILPLTAATGVLGAVLLRWELARDMDADARSVLSALAAYAALALDRAQLLEARREVAHVLQAAMLTDLPTVDGLTITAAYAPASMGEDVGGDWYDAIALPDGSTALMIGDVTGHDMGAAALMGQLRSMLRGLTWTFQEPPGAILRRLDDANLGVGLRATGSAVLAHLDPPGADGGRELRWSSAGHPPPVLLRTDGTADVLEGEPSMLLGFRAGVARHDHTVTLFPGDVLVLYTDGLVERRRENLRAGLARLVATVVSAASGEPWKLIEALAPAEIRRDDVAVLTVTVG
ncbi:SpoIIE family protein phosphatase [Cellulomonas humilata]|uniref:SpoIIE family protein phosphatase n=1 Tax=Cellulomonas humilata TaxID=144055 RepID=A0A7Y6DZM8_9CELL|nr:SpoIIE family protein phosphatase [Cellulomonas humilata]